MASPKAPPHPNAILPPYLKLLHQQNSSTVSFVADSYDHGWRRREKPSRVLDVGGGEGRRNVESFIEHFELRIVVAYHFSYSISLTASPFPAEQNEAEAINAFVELEKAKEIDRDFKVGIDA
ncbi:hypothetical protein ZIOFF_004778 [Zingiber officinale]|uniref:Uncharacterized protein n=1 Tax=Zingiber officinale TaxID=94328 RepID=A0A8J5HQB6_ZINOF|nr:hypothetical protein ZIOFF_004778 [Zingiber officinale]